jgi:AraC family transcriptional regulator
MYPKPQIELLPEIKLIGKKLRMSLLNNNTVDLWKNFMSFRHVIEDRKGNVFYAVQVYEPDYFKSYDPSVEFEKWAAVEVNDFANKPDEMESFTIPAGLYAVFHYKGSSLDSRIFQYIFTAWLPKSNYQLDNRPHFEILGEKYKNADPDSEEDIYIPVQQKSTSGHSGKKT